VAREGSHRLVTGWEQHPPCERQASANGEDCIYCCAFIPQVWQPNRVCCVTRKLAYRNLIVNDANRHPVSAQTSDDAETLIITPDYDRTYVTRRHWFQSLPTARHPDFRRELVTIYKNARSIAPHGGQPITVKDHDEARARAVPRMFAALAHTAMGCTPALQNMPHDGPEAALPNMWIQKSPNPDQGFVRQVA